MDARKIVRETYRRYTGGGGEDAFAFFAPDIVHTACPESDGVALCGTFRGVDGFKTRLAAIAEALEFDRWEPVGVVGDDETVLGRVAISGRVRATGAPFATMLAHVFTVRDGAIVAIEEHFDSAYFARLVAGPAQG